MSGNNAMEQVNSLLDGGAGFNPMDSAEAQKTQQQQAERQYHDACQVGAPFKTPAGKKLLAKLKQAFLDPATWVAGVTNYDDACSYGFAREGQKSVVQYILKCIEVMENGPPTTTEKE